MTQEKLYVITYEHKIEPHSSQQSKFLVGGSPEDAERKFLEQDPQGNQLRILGVSEFTIPGYQINLERLVGDSENPRIRVSFDPNTYNQLEKLAQYTGLSRAAVTRRATRIFSWMIDRMDEGHKFALLKEGEEPRIIDFE